jgi:hypothetical protein
MGHPATHCPKKSNSNDDDDSSEAATVNSVKKLQKDIKSMKKAFTTVKIQLEKLKEAESDISESEGEDDAALHFQLDVALQFAQVDRKFEPRIVKLFKQAGSKIKLNLREIILLDSQSTMDLFFNAALVNNTSKYKLSMILNSNGGTMAMSRKATLPGYNKSVWFSTRSITNAIALRNLIEQY